MVYSNKFVLSVLLQGQPQRELGNGVVKLPFDSEYALRLRNKNNRRACVKIYIDGENVSGTGYIIEANDHIDIRRHNEVDRAFKFVSLDSGEAVEFGKNGPNEDKVKGAIEARFFFEKDAPPVKVIEHHHHHYPRPPIRIEPQPWPRWPHNGPWLSNNVSSGTSSSMGPTLGSNRENYSSADIEPTLLDSSDRNREILGFDEPTNLSSNSDVLRKTTAKSARRYRTPDGKLDLTQINDCDTYSKGLADVAPASATFDSKILKDGCTVEGDTTGQNFHKVEFEAEETYTSLKVFLQGFEPEVEVVKAKSTSTKANDLEAENEQLRLLVLEEENKKLREQLANLQKKPTPKKKVVAKKKV